MPDKTALLKDFVAISYLASPIYHLRFPYASDAPYYQLDATLHGRMTFMFTGSHLARCSKRECYGRSALSSCQCSFDVLFEIPHLRQRCFLISNQIGIGYHSAKSDVETIFIEICRPTDSPRSLILYFVWYT